MENLEAELHESAGRFGKNVQIRILLMRHGEKASEEGELTEEGKSKIFEQFKNYTPPKDKVRLSAPNVVRNIQTLRIIEKTLDPEKGTRSYVDTALGSFPKNLSGVDYGEDPDFSSEFGDELRKIAGSSGANALNQYYIDFGSTRPDEKSQSPKELASKLAKRLLLEVKIAKRLKNDSQVDFIHITGTTIAFPLLQELIETQVENDPIDASGGNFVDKLGGDLKFSEGLIIEQTTDRMGNLAPLKVSFRGKEYTINLEKLQELSREGTKRPKKLNIKV